jgi:hypothetical protein
MSALVDRAQVRTPVLPREVVDDPLVVAANRRAGEVRGLLLGQRVALMEATREDGGQGERPGNGPGNASGNGQGGQGSGQANGQDQFAATAALLAVTVHAADGPLYDAAGWQVLMASEWTVAHTLLQVAQRLNGLDVASEKKD